MTEESTLCDFIDSPEVKKPRGVTIRPLTATSSREEELAVLDSLIGIFEDGSYLGGLFSTQFLEWAKEQIRYDFTLDIYSSLSETQKELDRVYSNYRDLKRNFEESEREWREGAKNDGLEFEKQLRETRDRLQESLQKCLELEEKVRAYECREASRIDQIRDLKCIVFDLEHSL